MALSGGGSFREHWNKLDMKFTRPDGTWPLSLPSPSPLPSKGHGEQERFLMAGRV